MLDYTGIRLDGSIWKDLNALKATRGISNKPFQNGAFQIHTAIFHDNPLGLGQAWAAVRLLTI